MLLNDVIIWCNHIFNLRWLLSPFLITVETVIHPLNKYTQLVCFAAFGMVCWSSSTRSHVLQPKDYIYNTIGVLCSVWNSVLEQLCQLIHPSAQGLYIIQLMCCAACGIVCWSSSASSHVLQPKDCSQVFCWTKKHLPCIILIYVQSCSENS